MSNHNLALQMLHAAQAAGAQMVHTSPAAGTAKQVAAWRKVLLKHTDDKQALFLAGGMMNNPTALVAQPYMGAMVADVVALLGLPLAMSSTQAKAALQW